MSYVFSSRTCSKCEQKNQADPNSHSPTGEVATCGMLVRSMVPPVSSCKTSYRTTEDLFVSSFLCADQTHLEREFTFVLQ